jgi:hypothetical protein
MEAQMITLLLKIKGAYMTVAQALVCACLAENLKTGHRHPS